MPSRSSSRPSEYLEFPQASHGATQDLHSLLHHIFGHREFRAHQQPVCEAAATGRDVLLVMPTGAGKSLCYQLPALARGGTALVISPLIALMDDQASKLTALGLRVARIHSGLSREDSRGAARAYLTGNLDFLFIAPERLRVPGFPEMLAKRKPALVAIDEAHCISQWGHDFRPDYRTLGQFLPALRPSPIIALTATATPAVQQDILKALQLRDPAVFITGFRRSNIQIEALDTSKPKRLEVMRSLLSPETARPAIVYASSRKSAEELASSLGERFPAAAYHAGLDPATRDRVQRAFLSGKLGVVVATVAFGMGVDKADVRTVIHAALPGSVEAYYQEIGRAGRDGNPSRAILLHSFADRRTLEFLLEKSYPSVPDIERVLAALADNVTTLPALQQRLKMEREVLEQCVDKLLIQGAVSADLEGNVQVTQQTRWKESYDQQLQYRRAQIDKIVAYAEGQGCRMAALVRHFGDLTDAGTPCGHCDICRPDRTSASAARQPDARDRSEIRQLLSLLSESGRSAGKVFTDLAWNDRRHFDALVDAIGKAGLLLVTTDSFRSDDGRDITYRKLALTADGRTVDDVALDTIWLRHEPSTQASTSKRSVRSRSGTRERTASTDVDEPGLTEEQAALEKRLKEWRLGVARARNIPPFTVFHDSVLRTIARARPSNVQELEAIRGLGQEKSNRYGADLLALCRDEDPGHASPSSAFQKPAKAAKPESQTASRLKAAVSDGKERAAETRPAERAAVPPRTPPSPAPPALASLSPEQQQLEARLRQWRAEEATSAGLPSFFVLSDTNLRQIAALEPTLLRDLESIQGLGTDKLQRYGPAIVELCRSCLQ